MKYVSEADDLLDMAEKELDTAREMDKKNINEKKV